MNSEALKELIADAQVAAELYVRAIANGDSLMVRVALNWLDEIRRDARHLQTSSKTEVSA